MNHLNVFLDAPTYSSMYLSVGIISMLFFAELSASYHLTKRPKFGIRILAALLLLTLAGLLIGSRLQYLPFDDFKLYVLNEGFRYLSILLISILGLWICFDEKPGPLLFCAATGYIIQHLYSQILLILQSLMVPAYFDVIAPWLVTISITILYMYIYFVLSPKLKHQAAVENKRTRIFFLLTIFLVIVISVIRDFYEPESPSLMQITRIFSVLCCVLLLLIRSGFLVQGQLENEVETIKQLNYKERMQYQHSRQNIELINVKCHDLKKRLEQYEDKMIGLTQEEIDEINDAIAIYDTKIQTGNEVLDTILTDRSLICEQKSITFSCIADGAALGFLSTGDTYSLFANAIDNAIEAVMGLENPEDRIISLTVRQKLGMVSILIDNYYKTEDLTFEEGLPKTTKEDSRYHGFGTKSMKMIVQKYHGEMNITADDMFHFSILLPIPEK